MCVFSEHTGPVSQIYGGGGSLLVFGDSLEQRVGSEGGCCYLGLSA